MQWDKAEIGRRLTRLGCDGTKTVEPLSLRQPWHYDVGHVGVGPTDHADHRSQTEWTNLGLKVSPSIERSLPYSY
jgi:hypothetical protein